MEIVLGRGKYTAIIDEEDYNRVVGYKFCFTGGYAAARIKGTSKRIKLHRLIMNAPNGVDVDHKNGNKLDCRKENLRLATDSQNHANSKIQRKRAHIQSRYKGVSWRNRRGGVWTAGIKVNYKTIYLGQYLTEEDAARAYDRAARDYFGEFARTNFGC